MRRIIVVFLCVCLLLPILSGCGGQTDDVPQTTAAQMADTAQTAQTEQTAPTGYTYIEDIPMDTVPDLPAVTPSATGLDHEILPVTGTLSCEPLTVLDWDCGRASATSTVNVWETEDGYYLQSNSLIYYADKSDLSFWMPVCSDPSCLHERLDESCGAYADREFLLWNGKIVRSDGGGGKRQFGDRTVELYGGHLVCTGLAGENIQLLYYSKDVDAAIRRSGTVFSRDILTPEYMVYNYGVLNHEGLYDLELRIVDETGEYVLYTDTRDYTMIAGMPRSGFELYGDNGFFTGIFGTSDKTTFCRVVDHELIVTDLAGLPYLGAHISGNTMRGFYPGDGYYDIDLTTREEVKLADAQFANSLAHIIQPNCILESNIISDESVNLRDTPDGNVMRLFDGEKWMDVALPEELKNLGEEDFLGFVTLTSDRIILRLIVDKQDWDAPIRYYQICLGTDQPVLELMAEIG